MTLTECKTLAIDSACASIGRTPDFKVVEWNAKSPMVLGNGQFYIEMFYEGELDYRITRSKVRKSALRRQMDVTSVL